MRSRLIDNRGAALVEFAIVAVLLITLVLGIIEFGLLMRDYLALGQATREGARSASLGSPTSVVETRVLDSAPTLRHEDIVVVLERRAVSPGDWTTVGNTADGQYNDAQTGDHVRVMVTYPHTLITGNLFSWLAGGGSSIAIQSDMVMRRE